MCLCDSSSGASSISFSRIMRSGCLVFNFLCRTCRWAVARVLLILRHQKAGITCTRRNLACDARSTSSDFWSAQLAEHTHMGIGENGRVIASICHVLMMNVDGWWCCAVVVWCCSPLLPALVDPGSQRCSAEICALAPLVRPAYWKGAVTYNFDETSSCSEVYSFCKPDVSQVINIESCCE